MNGNRRITTSLQAALEVYAGTMTMERWRQLFPDRRPYINPKDYKMKETFSIRIKRAGLADLPELCETEDVEKAAAVVQMLLGCRDQKLQEVVVSVVRI